MAQKAGGSGIGPVDIREDMRLQFEDMLFFGKKKRTNIFKNESKRI